VQLVIARTQSGKTGSMVEFLALYINSNLIPIENIYLITGLSSNDWVKQTQTRFPKIIWNNIYHNGQLKKFKEDVRDKENILILIDETQMACKVKQTISAIFKELQWKLDYMMEKDIKIVQFSATPDGMLFALNEPKWPREHINIHIMNNGLGYYGVKEMLSRRQIYQYADICGRNNDGELIENEEIIYLNIKKILDIALENFTTPKYILFRIKPQQKIYYENNICETLNMYYSEEKRRLFNTQIFHYYTMNGNVENLPRFLYNTPDKFTFVMVKEKLKCAQTLEYIDENDIVHDIKCNIGIMVERWTQGVSINKSNDSFVIQGFLGRLCGYNSHNTICFTNLESINKYEKMWDSEFDTEVIKSSNWNSNSTKQKGGSTISRPVINTAEEIVIQDENNVVEPNTYRILKADDCETTIKFIKDIFKKFFNRSKNKLPKTGEFYTTSITDKSGIKTLKDVIEKGICNANTRTGTGTRDFFPCYSDINNHNTLHIVIPIFDNKWKKEDIEELDEIYGRWFVSFTP
jgi:hypothetical protein